MVAEDTYARILTLNSMKWVKKHKNEAEPTRGNNQNGLLQNLISFKILGSPCLMTGTDCIVTVQSSHRPPESYLRLLFKVPMAPPNIHIYPWSYDRVLDTWQPAHIYGHLQCSTVILP